MNLLLLLNKNFSLKIQKIFFMFGIIFLSFNCSNAQNASPAEFGKKLDEVVPGLLEKYKEPGLAVALIDNCQVVWIKTYGKADIKQNTPVAKDTFFQMGSISKTLTAWGVMRLAEKGLIKLDEPVDRYLKRWKLSESEFNKDVTVQRLLNHTASINAPSVSGINKGEKVPTLIDELSGKGPSGEAVRVVGKPGEKHRYSGGGYTILQLLIEDVTGRSFEDYMREEVLKPLGMNDTYFGWNKTIEKHVATPYKTESADPHPHRLFSSLSAAGMYSTPEDMARFVTAQCAENKKVISNETFNQMIKSDKVSSEYGFGYEVFPPFQGTDIVGHSGSNLGWKTNFVVVPSKGIGIVLLTNVDEGKARMDVFKAFRNYVMTKLK